MGGSGGGGGGEGGPVVHNPTSAKVLVMVIRFD